VRLPRLAPRRKGRAETVAQIELQNQLQDCVRIYSYIYLAIQYTLASFNGRFSSTWAMQVGGRWSGGCMRALPSSGLSIRDHLAHAPHRMDNRQQIA
jgi:hypothetical protein